MVVVRWHADTTTEDFISCVKLITSKNYGRLLSTLKTMKLGESEHPSNISTVIKSIE